MTKQEVFLRPMTIEDTEKIIRWRNKDFVRKNFIYQKPFTRQSQMDWVKNQVEPGHVEQFIICLPSGREIGSVYFRDIDRKEGCAEYGIFIGEEDAVGCGYGSETAKKALEYAFENMKLNKIFLRFLSDNLRAKRSYENAGFRLLRDRQETVCLEQGECTVLFMEIDRAAWEKVRNGNAAPPFQDRER